MMQKLRMLKNKDMVSFDHAKYNGDTVLVLIASF